jgi:hypothetical protein
MERTGRSPVEVVSRGISLQVLKNPLKPSFRKSGVPAQIRTKHLPHMFLERYRYPIPLGELYFLFIF